MKAYDMNFNIFVKINLIIEVGKVVLKTEKQ
jgi:hypothetical protein